MFSTTVGLEPNALKEQETELGKGLSRIELEICKRLYETTVRGYRENWGQGKWTEAIRWQLFVLGKAQGYVVYPEPIPFPDATTPPEVWAEQAKVDWLHEWLLDLVWLAAPQSNVFGDKSTPSHPQVFPWKGEGKFRLACECEWADIWWQLLEDFLKLTVVRSELKLFIYTNGEVKAGPEEKMEPARICREACPHHHDTRYLLIGIGKRKGFRIDAWTE